MAIKNIEIIASYKLENGMELETELNTFARWKQLGFKVKKGEKSEHKITVWKPVKVKVENEEGKVEKKQKLILKKSAFFTREQVEKIEE